MANLCQLLFFQIQETDFNKVCEVLAQNFRITREAVLDSLEVIVDPAKIKKTRPVRAGSSRPLTHSFDCTNTITYCITSMDSENLRSQALTIMGMSMWLVPIIRTVLKSCNLGSYFLYYLCVYQDPCCPFVCTRIFVNWSQLVGVRAYALTFAISFICLWVHRIHTAQGSCFEQQYDSQEFALSR